MTVAAHLVGSSSRYYTISGDFVLLLYVVVCCLLCCVLFIMLCVVYYVVYIDVLHVVVLRCDNLLANKQSIILTGCHHIQQWSSYNSI